MFCLNGALDFSHETDAERGCEEQRMEDEKPAHSRKSGREPFESTGQPLHASLVDFWSWHASGLLTNTLRGSLAEYIVGLAIDVDMDSPREDWATWDLTTRHGVKVEVKSAAYLQAWHQRSLSKISFNVSKRRGWDPKTAIEEHTPSRHADVYVLALFAHQDKSTANPLNVDQWQFWVVPTSWLDVRQRSQQSITLTSLQREFGAPGEPARGLTWLELREHVERATPPRDADS